MKLITLTQRADSIEMAEALVSSMHPKVWGVEGYETDDGESFEVYVYESERRHGTETVRGTHAICGYIVRWEES